MKIRLTKPLPQIGKVVPAGVILDDAPEALKEKLVRQGRAEWVDARAGVRVDPPPAPLPSKAVVEKVERVPDLPKKPEPKAESKPKQVRAKTATTVRRKRKKDE